MKNILSYIIVFLCLINCNRDYSSDKAYGLFPKEVKTILKINHLDDFKNNALQNDVLNLLKPLKISNALSYAKSINPNSTVYIGQAMRANDTAFILTTTYHPNFFIDSINHKNFIKKANAKSIIKAHDIDFYFRALGPFIALSKQKEALNLMAPPNNELRDDSFRLMDERSSFSMVSTLPSSGLQNLMIDDSLGTASKVILDLSLNPSTLSYNGVVTFKDSVQNLYSLLKGNAPQQVRAAQVAPNYTKKLFSVTYNDFSTIDKNMDDSINSRPKDSLTELTGNPLYFSSEIALAEFKNGRALFIGALDIDLLASNFNLTAIEERFRATDIFKIDNSAIFKSLSPLPSLSNARYAAIIKNFMVVTKELKTLKAIIKSVLNNATLDTLGAFKQAEEQLARGSSIFIYCNEEVITEKFNTKAPFNAHMVQYRVEDDYALITGILNTYKKPPASKSVNEAFSVTLDNVILSPIQTAKNHTNNTHDIVVQDIKNQLYLISASGRILWKKQLPEPILGRVEQIDMYQNGRLQLAFATSHKLYVLDRNGNEVKPFPISFKDNITQPLSVFDYDNNKTYRLLITQGKDLVMYDARGKKVKGFNFKSAKNRITSQPQHFRIGRKDYIVFKTTNQISILNRRGQIRVPVSTTFKWSNNPIFLYKNTFTTTNATGQLIQINTKGKVKVGALDIAKDHDLEMSSKTLVALSENQLRIRQKTITLDFGNYTAPKLFYLNDKIYISLTDQQTNKVLLFDSQAKMIPNFPIYGTEAAEMQRLDNEKGLELITQGDPKTILVYKIY